jgi:hypothetical protein
MPWLSCLRAILFPLFLTSLACLSHPLEAVGADAKIIQLLYKVAREEASGAKTNTDCVLISIGTPLSRGLLTVSRSLRTQVREALAVLKVVRITSERQIVEVSSRALQQAESIEEVLQIEKAKDLLLNLLIHRPESLGSILLPQSEGGVDVSLLGNEEEWLQYISELERLELSELKNAVVEKRRLLILLVAQHGAMFGPNELRVFMNGLFAEVILRESLQHLCTTSYLRALDDEALKESAMALQVLIPFLLSLTDEYSSSSSVLNQLVSDYRREAFAHQVELGRRKLR